MADAKKELQDIVRDIEKVRKSLAGTQSHAPDNAYVWSQIGDAVTKLRRSERDIEDVIRAM